MIQRPAGLPNNCVYYDLRQIEAYVKKAELCTKYAVRDSTVYVGHLATPVQIAGVDYHTAIIEVNGHLILCTGKAYSLMNDYSKRSTLSCRFSRWAAQNLDLAAFPYFHGENSFIPESSPQRRQVSWIGSRYYSSMRTVEQALLVTFKSVTNKRQVVVRTNMTEPHLFNQLALVREFLIELLHLTQLGVDELVPSSKFALRLPTNLPERPSGVLPLLTPQQIRTFIYQSYRADTCRIAEKHDTSTRAATNLADYHIRPPRELRGE